MAGEISIEFGADAEAIKRWDTKVQVHDSRVVVEFRHSSGASITTTEHGFYWEWPTGNTWIYNVAPTVIAALASIKAAEEANK